MPTLENLTVEQLERLTRSDALLNSLLNDPETRKSTLRLLKKKNPNLPMPEIEAEEIAEAAVATERKEREKLSAELAEQRARDSVRDQRAKAVADGCCTQEEIPALEKFMIDNEIVSYEKGAKLYKQAKRAEASSASVESADRTLSMPEDKELYKNPALWARRQAAKAIDELKERRA